MPSLLPAREHRVARTIQIAQNRDAVWARITDYANSPDWRPKLQGVHRVADRDDRPVWREGDLLMETVEEERPRRLVRRIADPGAFGGEWRFTLEEAGTGCRLVITEDGWVQNPVMRLVSRYRGGHTREINRYLRALAHSFGDDHAQPADTYPS